MYVIQTLYGEFQSRWAIFRNRDGRKSKTQRTFALVEIFCFPISVLSILLLPIQLLLSALGVPPLVSPILSKYIYPVLLAGAVGYLTNWLAILMLFHPYEPVKWLFFWPQGLIPRNKEQVAKAVGYQIGTTLLPPDKLAEEFCGKIMNFFSNPDVGERLKEHVREILTKHEDDIIQFAIPLLEKGIRDSVAEFVTPERVKYLWEELIWPRLMSEKTRDRIASGVIHFGEENASELTSAIREMLEDYLVQKFDDILVLSCFKEKIAGWIMDFFADRKSIHRLITEWLASPSTHEMIRSNLNKVCLKLNDWFDSAEGITQIKSIATDSRSTLNRVLGKYLKTMFPKWVKDTLASPKVWDLFQNQFLPRARDGMSSFILKHKKEVAENLNLSKRVEDAINAQDVRKFHAMLNEISAEHLGAIQVLGFVLGILVGCFQLFAA